MTYEGMPALVETVEAHGEMTLVVDPARVVEAAMHLRDVEGFNFLSDIAAADYLGWGKHGVSGYIATAAGRDLNTPMTQGYQSLPKPKPKRFAVNYHLLSVSARPRRVRLQVWLDDGEPVPTVLPVWPGADWHEREAFDLMGITFSGTSIASSFSAARTKTSSLFWKLR